MLTLSAKMELIRSPLRPNIEEFISKIFDDFIELHGDRLFGDDAAICGGIATIGGIPVTVIGHRKGRNTEENIACNFAMPHPEGYRKALRLAKQAEKFNRPIIFFIDTKGAFPGADAEMRGQGEAIARNLYELMNLSVPSISIVTGEGGSGGALAIGVSNEVYMLENSLYSIISPRGFASILWKDASREKEAGELLKMTASDLYKFGIIEGVISEGKPMFENIKGTILNSLLRLKKLSPEDIKQSRYDKFRAIGKKGE